MFYDTIIIGAGAAGLIAARELSRAKKRVLVLEADNRIGGRIQNVNDPDFGRRIELGAEFLHGELPVTWGMLKEYGIEKIPVKGESWSCEQSKLEKNEEVIEQHEILEKELLKLTTDCSIEKFLEKSLQDEQYTSLKTAVKRFVQGYDTADVGRAGTFAFREEWLNYKADDHSRIEGGYGRLIDAIAADAESNGCGIQLNETVKSIRWEKKNVEVITDSYKIFNAKSVLVTVSLGVLRNINGPAYIEISPAPADHLKAVQELGFGSVIKILFHFERPFWKDKKHTRPAPASLNFMFSDATIPTWWTQLPDESPILTGWLGGPDAKKLKNATPDEIKDIALESLAYIFKEEFYELHELLTAWKVKNWCNDPFVLGSYRYNTVNEQHALEILEQPIDDTLYFAGEAIYKGPATGTVEAALVSGLFAAEKMLNRW